MHIFTASTEVLLDLVKKNEKLSGRNITVHLDTPPGQCKPSCAAECAKIMFCSAVNVKLQGSCECEFFSFDVFRSGLDDKTQPAPGWALHVDRYL